MKTLPSAVLAMPALWLLAVCQPLAAQPGNARPVPGNGLIDQPGAYVLTGDRFSNNNDRPAILISASNATLDLNGNLLSGPGGKLGVGIRIQGATGVSVMNGFITRTAFGVIVSSSANVRLSGLQISGEGLPVVSAPPETGIMIAQSRNVVVENNSIYNTGLGIFVRGGRSWGNRIASNTVTAGTNGALGICYNPADNDPQGPRGDIVYQNVVTGFATGLQASATSEANVFKGNFIFHGSGMAVDLRNPSNMDMDNVKVRLP